MKTFFIVAMSAMRAFGAAVFSALVTITAWDIQIEPRAFQCNHNCGWPFDNYWTSMTDHKAAGDAISAGWAWDELEAVREMYIRAFFLLWIVSTLIPFRLSLRSMRRPNGSTAASPAMTIVFQPNIKDAGSLTRRH
jgi:hypothetical protein